MPSLYKTLTESVKRMVSKLMPGLLRGPDRVDEAAEVRRAGDAGCLGDEPVSRPGAEPKRDFGCAGQSPAMMARVIGVSD